MIKHTRCVRCEKYVRRTLPLLGRDYCIPCYSNEKKIHDAVKAG